MNKLRAARPPLEELPEYAVRVSKRAKTMHLKVSPLGRVEVVIPRAADQRNVHGFVRKHAQWLKKTLTRLDEQRQHDPALCAVLPKSISLRAVDEEWRVAYRKIGTDHVEAIEERTGELLVRGAVDDIATCKEVLRAWISQQARAHLVPWLHRLSIELRLPFDRVMVRGQKTRWGSCSSRKAISINRALLFLPRAQVRYLFVHELCHTVHLNHSARYWALVKRHQPDYELRDREIREAARFVPLWVQSD